MTESRVLAICLIGLTVIACGLRSEDSVSTGTWVGTVTTEGNVTTVVNESGSVWGGTARLVEEASIGVDLGEDPYMLGRPGGVAASDDRIYVLDQDASIAHVYDLEGVHLFSFGRAGQGPGEFQKPYSIGISDDGRVFVGDAGNRRINVYTADGEHIADYPLGRAHCCGREMVVTADGVPYWQVMGELHELDRGGFNHPMQAFGEDGPYGEPTGPPPFDYRWWTIRVGDDRWPPPFAPQMVWRLAPSGALIWGVSESYRFELRHPAGQTLRVERVTEPVAPEAGHLAWARVHYTASVRRVDAAFNLDAAEIPEHKPWFEGFVPTHDGGIWVVRAGESFKDPDCDDTHTANDWAYHSRNWRCWDDRKVIDAFDAEGRYAGEIEAPEGIVLNAIASPWVRGDTVIAAIYSPDDVIRVKRYRVAPPGEN